MLTVYRASAGAGKTHRLTGEYLTLLFSAPNAYRRILAVTFTNKATDEMKSRIVEELFRLSSGKPSDYVGRLAATYSLTEEQVRTQAGRILKAILHDYSAFNISTIDRFFQQTMRAFTREIGLQGGYGLEMDEDLVLSSAVDNLLMDLEKPESRELLGWLLRFAEDNIERGYGWDLRKDIMALSRELFKESYKTSGEELTKEIDNKTSLEEYKKTLYGVIHSIEAEAKRIGERGMAVLEKYSLTPKDFYRGNITVALFEKLAGGELRAPNATFCKIADNVDACYKKSTPIGLLRIIGCAFEDGLNDCVKEVISLFSDMRAYNTAREIIRYYYTLGILTDVSRQIAAYREENNVMLIADTTELLNKIIGGSDAPFIYEKTGTRVDHYMIDEFQDTSGMQWSNFRPLIEESLAHGRDNLIVGDVKQSIYRFRNSDWKLLDEQVQADFSPILLSEKTLNENWRSCRHIVEFNNAFFTTLPEVLQENYNATLLTSSLSEEQQMHYQSKIKSAYTNSKQKVPTPLKNKDGHVRIEFVSGDYESDWKTKALERLPAILEQLQENGYALKDIAILVRTNREGAMVADNLLSYKEAHPDGKYRYDIISDDSLFVNSSLAVRFLLALLRYLKNPEERMYELRACYAYQVLRNGKITAGDVSFPPEIAEELAKLSRQSLYEVTEGLFRLFADDFHEDEQVFVQAFLDIVVEYSRRESADLGRFLKWWNETGKKKTIASPDGQNAIRILTIHKSKGLGFKVVIVPFCDWEIDHHPFKQVILWCKPQVKPFNRLGLVPVRYGQSLGDTFFAEDYFRERLYASIDNLNTMYVAFTRSKEELIVLSPSPLKTNEETGEVEKITSMADALWSSLLKVKVGSLNTDEGIFELGEWWHPDTDKSEGNMPEELIMGRIHSISPDDRLQLRLQGKGLTFDSESRKHGTLMHDILSQIATVKDVPVVVENLYLSGAINKKEAELLIIRLEELLKRPEVQRWYDSSARVLNEVDILVGNGLSKRPDRVIISDEKVIVVDYKFGEKQDNRYPRQVKEYMKLIQEMGYRQVEGYLWYVELGVIEAVV